MASQVDFLIRGKPSAIELPFSSLEFQVSEFTIGVLHTPTRVLLKYADRGPCEDKWNPPGGKIDQGENKEECVLREVSDETGYRINENSLRYNGIVECTYLNDRKKRIVHIFSTDKFTGELQSSKEGFVSWKRKAELPIESMWKDTSLWLAPAWEGKEFYVNATYKDKTGNEMLDGHITMLRDRAPFAKKLKSVSR